MFDLKADGTLSVNRERKLTTKQLMALSRMEPGDKARYLANLLGLNKSRVFVPRVRSSQTDQLSLKRKSSVLHMLRQLTSTGVNHSPTRADVGQWLGVEIECFIPSECDFDTDSQYYYEGSRNGRQALREAIESNRIKRCNVKEDGSLNSESGFGVECTLLINSKHGFEDLKKLCSVLDSFGAFVNRSCGLHIHFDARHLDVRGAAKFGKSIGFALPVLSQMVPPSRRNNSYCQMGVSRVNGNRYYAVNLTAYQKFKTVEVRLHSGTTSFSKIKNWIEILSAIGSAKLTRTISDSQALIDRLTLPEHLVEYMDRRITEFSTSDSQEVA